MSICIGRGCGRICWWGTSTPTRGRCRRACRGSTCPWKRTTRTPWRLSAAQEACGEIWLYCALGGRLDHLLGNLQAVAFAVRRGIPARIVDEENEILVFSGGSVTVPERAGYSLSVLALSDRCTGVSIHGTKYELEHVTVENSFPIGVSNQWRGTAEITVEQGVLAVIESKM